MYTLWSLWVTLQNIYAILNSFYITSYWIQFALDAEELEFRIEGFDIEEDV